METVCNECVQHVVSVQSPPVLRSLLTSVGLLRYRHPALLDTILTWYQTSLARGDQLTTRDLTSLLMSMASVDYAVPSQHTQLLDTIIGMLDPQSMPEPAWLDTVWALTVLGKATHQHLESVLNPTFASCILCKLKLEVLKEIHFQFSII